MGSTAPPQPPVRLFISGLAPPSSGLPAALEERFSSFGRVTGVTVPPPTAAQRALAGEGDDPTRGFAYVDLVPKDDASVRRAVAAVRFECRGERERGRRGACAASRRRVFATFTRFFFLLFSSLNQL